MTGRLLLSRSSAYLSDHRVVLALQFDRHKLVPSGTREEFISFFEMSTLYLDAQLKFT